MNKPTDPDTSNALAIPDYLMQRQDNSPDEDFYRQPRLVNHIDDATIKALTNYYREVLAGNDAVLDLMSSWVSHLPDDLVFKEVTGLGMNAEELAANPALTKHLVHNLNTTPQLPLADASFDAVVIAVSIQYLTQPVAVFAEISRVLKPGGQCLVAMSHRMFPTKAIYAFHAMGPEDRVKLVSLYMEKSGLQAPDFIDRSPENADPLWIVRSTKPNA